MSLNIAVCEDDEKDAEMLYALLDIVCREWKLAAQIHRYVSAEELLAKCNTPPLHILILFLLISIWTG